MKKLWAITLLIMFGRQNKTVKNAHASWRRRSLKAHGKKSWVSGQTKKVEVHHGFPVRLWPCFAFADWNDWPMTYDEHRGHKRSYHSWEGKFKSRFARLFISNTPVGLYVWKYFVWHWWKGLIVLPSSLIVLFAVYYSLYL